MSFLYTNKKSTSRNAYFAKASSGAGAQAPKKKSFLADLARYIIQPSRKAGSDAAGGSGMDVSSDEPYNPFNPSRYSDPAQSSGFRASASSGRTSSSSASGSARGSSKIMIKKEGLDSLLRIFDVSAGGLVEVNLYKFIQQVENEEPSLSLILGQRTALEIIREIKKLHSVVASSFMEYVSWARMQEMIQNSTNLDFRLCHPLNHPSSHPFSRNERGSERGAKDSLFSLEQYKMVLERTGYEFSPRLDPSSVHASTDRADRDGEEGGEGGVKGGVPQRRAYETQKEELNTPFKGPSGQQTQFASSVSDQKTRLHDDNTRLHDDLLSIQAHETSKKHQVNYDAISERIDARMDAGRDAGADDMELDSADEDGVECLNKAYQSFTANLTPQQRLFVNERLTHPPAGECIICHLKSS